MEGDLITLKQEKPYFETLRDYVRLAGEEIVNRSNEIVPENVKGISDLNIYISFDQDCGSIPVIEWTIEVIPDIYIKKHKEDRLQEIKNIKTLADLNEKIDRDNGHF